MDSCYAKKLNVAEMYIIKTIKQGTQSKLYEQKIQPDGPCDRDQIYMIHIKS